MKKKHLFSQPSLILLTVTGIFREKSEQGTSSSHNNDQLLRSFHRSLVIVPVGSGFCIKNDMLHINTVTLAQVRMAFKTPMPQPTPVTSSINAAVPPVQPIVAPPTAGSSLAPDDATKLQMIQAISQLSQMNMEWSKK